MKNMFGFGTDEIKCELNFERKITAVKFFKILVGNFPLTKTSLGINSLKTDMIDFVAKIQNLSLAELLEMAIKACEPYLVPDEAIISFSYSPDAVSLKDEDYHNTAFSWNDKDKIFHFYPKSKFYQSLKLWLVMSALYSESLHDGVNTVKEKLLPLHLSDASCDSIEKFFKNNWDNSDRRLKNFIINDEGRPLDSYYEIMVVNGLLSRQFNRDGSIKTKQTIRNKDKASDRLPEIIVPNFAWNQDTLKCNIDYDSRELDFQLITQYLIERLTGANFIHYKELIKVFTNELPEYFPKLNNSFPDSVFNILALYPLLHCRLNLLDSMLLANEDSEDYSAPTTKDWENLADNLKYQIFVYFPLVDLFFHSLLKIRYNSFNYHSDLANELKSIYETEPLYLKGSIKYDYKNRENVISKDVTIRLSDGSTFTVGFSRAAHSESYIEKLISVAVELNWKNPSFSSCMKDAFNTDYERIKYIPESVFADYIKEIMKIRNGFLGPEMYTGEEYQGFITDYFLCRQYVFIDYMDIVKDIDINKFKKFVNEVIIRFDKKEYQYLFEYNIKNGFNPVYILQRNKKLEGVSFDDLNKELTIISKDVINKFYDYCNNCKSEVINIKNLKHFMSGLNVCLKDTQALLERHYQHFKFEVKLFDKIIKMDSCKTKYGDKFINRLNENIKENCKKPYKLTINKFMNNIDKLISRYEKLDDISNDDVDVNETNLLRKSEKIENCYKALVNSIFNEEGIIDSYYSMTDLSDIVLADIFRDLVIYFYDNDMIRKYYDKEFIKWYLEDDENDITKDEYLYPDFEDPRQQIDRLIKFQKELANINNYFRNILKMNIDFDFIKLGEGDIAFYNELHKFSNPVDKEILSNANKLNSYDMVHLMYAIAEYSYMNSRYFPNFYNYKSCINFLQVHQNKIVDFRKRKYYSSLYKQDFKTIKPKK